MLVHVISAANRALYGRLLTAMFRQRHDVFVVRKQWKLASANGLERDEFDDMDRIVYAVIVDSHGEIVGSQRFLPGDGPTMSAGPLANFWDRPAPAGPRAWEVSRSIIAARWDSPDFAEASAALGLSEFEWGLSQGVERVFGVGDARFVGSMVQLGWDVELHGLPTDYPEGGQGVALSWRIDVDTLAKSRESYGYHRAYLYQSPPAVTQREIDAEEFEFLDLVSDLSADPVLRARARAALAAAGLTTDAETQAA